ncbi:inositol monophosphatase family protein [Dongia sp. agr-C8]
MMGEAARQLLDLPDDHSLAQIERTAVEIARLAGAEIVTALGGMLAVKYKSDVARQEGDARAYRDPVSEVDHRVEVLLRARIAERFPQHDIIGEEINDRPGDRPYAEYVWAVDPVDGTANFINGFPLFAASIGVLHRGRPVVGAVWCSASHALRAGVYHGHVGGDLHFDEVPTDLKVNPGVQRRLAGDPGGGKNFGFLWDTRKTGSAAIECAFVAAGLLRVSRFEAPNVWDVAGGLALVRAAGLDVLTIEKGEWRPLEVFAGPGGDIRRWRQPLIIGDAPAVAELSAALPPKPEK